MNQNEFPVTSQNRVRQVSKRGGYDRQLVYKVLDLSLICNVAFVQENGPVVIPMLFARNGDDILFHGSTKSRLMQMLSSGQALCLSATLVDGLVLAKSLFHHSMNYRSVSVFATGRELTNDDERMDALRIITDKVMPKRWEDARLPNAQEMKATCVVAASITTASTKIRTGGPIDDTEDLELPVWSGVVPLRQLAEPAIHENVGATALKTPDYVEAWREQYNRQHTSASDNLF